MFDKIRLLYQIDRMLSARKGNRIVASLEDEGLPVREVAQFLGQCRILVEKLRSFIRIVVS